MDQSQLSKVERNGPAVAGWRRFCQVASALGWEVEIRLRPKSGN
jgi:hypothetical protein